MHKKTVAQVLVSLLTILIITIFFYKYLNKNIEIETSTKIINNKDNVINTLSSNLTYDIIYTSSDLRGNIYEAESDIMTMTNGGTEEALDGWDARLDYHIPVGFDLRVFGTYFDWENKANTYENKGEQYGIAGQYGLVKFEVGYRDEENRKKLPKNIIIPSLPTVNKDINVEEIKVLVEKKFKDHPGSVNNFFLPTTRKLALQWLKTFLKERFKNFGDYEDAMSTESSSVFHSLLSPLLNIGLLTPREVVSEAIEFNENNEISINSLEGFIRQIIGWREFIKGTYDVYEDKMVNSNFWNHNRKLTPSWYDASTGIEPLDHFISEVNSNAYTHHIPRLMIISNLMNLTGIHPKEIYRWFMEMFVDSSDWVMVPNVYSMGTYSDGGIFATKPYLCGSNYILKMSNFKKGEWCDIVDGLYWSFIERNIHIIKKNYRMAMMANAFTRITEERKDIIFTKANKFIKNNSL